MTLPSNFKQRLSEKKIIPFVGAGVSMNVEDKTGNTLFPSWKQLLLEAAERLKNNDKNFEANLVEGYLGVNPPKYLKSAQEAQEYLGAEFYDLIKEKINIRYENVNPDSLKIPRAIWEISDNLIITTNYDKVLSWSCPNYQDISTWNIEATKEQADLIRTQSVLQPIVWHLHGHIDDVRNIILTPDGYQELYPANTDSQTKYETALKTLQTLFVSHTFLFIGFSFDDEYFVNQLRNVQKLFQGTTGKHFVLIREAEKAKLPSLNLELEPITFEDFGAKMLEKLYEIRDESNQSKPKPRIKEKSDKELTATERFNPKNRVVYIPFNQKGNQVLGREENLKEVRETLAQGLPTNIGQAVSFQGLGGLGKTQLAVEYAYEFESEYLNGVIWLTVDQDIDKQLVDICDKAKWVSPISDIKVKLDVARNRLKTITDCLIVLDNVEVFDERIKQYLPPPQKNIHLLATSRNEIIGFNPVWLKLLTIEQSVQMLVQESRGIIKDETERRIVIQIAEELGNLPLALELSGGFLRYRPIGWENYLSLLKQNPREAFKEKFLEGSFTNHDTDVYRTLKVSETLFEEEPLLREILDLLTWSGTSPMGIDLLSHLLGKKQIELLEALGLGELLNLLVKSPERDAYAIHRLVGEVRKEDIPLSERVEWVENIFRLLGDWFQNIREDFNSLADYEGEFEHLVKWQSHAEKFGSLDNSRLLWLQAYLPAHKGRFNEAKNIVAKAIGLFQKTDSKHQQNLGLFYQDFSTLLTRLGEATEGLRYAKESLEIILNTSEENYQDIAKSYNSIALALFSLHRYQEAIENQKKSLEIYLEKFGEKHYLTANAFHNLGSYYGSLKKHQEAFNYQQKALDIRFETVGENHPSTASSFNNLGLTYGHLKKYQEEFDNQQKALDIRLELLGEKHPETANSLHNLSFHYEKLRQYETAIDYASRAFLVHREVFGNFHKDTLTSLVNLSSIYTRDKQGHKALKLIDEFLRIVPKTNFKYKELENQKRWILEQVKQPGFRQQPINSAKKKRGKKRK